MAEPTPIMDDAVRLLNTDSLLRAARDLTVAAMRGDFESDPKVRDAATVIVASRTPPDPTTLLRLADEMADHARTYRAAIAALGFADVPMERAEHEGEAGSGVGGDAGGFHFWSDQMTIPYNIEAAIAASQIIAATKGKPANYAEIVITDDLFAGDFGDGSERTLIDELRIAKRMGPCRECDRGVKKGDLVRVVKMADSEGFYGGRLCAACCDETYARYEDDMGGDEESK